MIARILGIVAVVLGICVAVYWQILENRMWEQVFRDYTRQLQAKHEIRRRELIFVEEEPEEYISEEHAGLVASDEEEETEALYWS